MTAKESQQEEQPGISCKAGKDGKNAQQVSERTNAQDGSLGLTRQTLHGGGGPATITIPGLTRMSDITARATKWFWPGYIPFGEITILEGAPGTNKSSFACDAVARLSRGEQMPCAMRQRGRPHRGGAIFMIGEDSVGKTVKGRLLAAGADLSKIGVLDNITIPSGLGRLREAIHQIGAKIVVMDTLNDFLDCNTSGNQAVRRALRPLREVAEETGVAVVVLRHFIKSSGGCSLHRGGGSVAITAMARSQLKLYKHPTDPNMRVLVQDKSNLGPLSPSLLFEIVPTDGNQFRLEWHGETDLTIDELERTHGGSKLEAAKGFLLDALADGPKEVNWIFERAKGICGERTLHEAKKGLELVTQRKGKGRGHKVYWAIEGAQLLANAGLQGVESDDN